METITNVASAASKAIFGEPKTINNETGGQEPVSGEQGLGTTSEPFDKGNAAAGEAGSARNETAGDQLFKDPVAGDSSALTGTTHHTEHSDAPLVGDKAPSTLPETIIPPSDSVDNPVTTSTHASSSSSDNKETTGASTRVGAGIHTPDSKKPTNPASAANYAAPDPHRDTEKTGVVSGHTLNPTKAHDVVPTERASNPGAAPDSSAGPHTKQQGADKPGDVPTGEQEEAVKSKKDDAEEIMKNRDPNDHSGEPMKMHDGPEKPGATQEERRNSKAGNPGGQEHGKDPKGTGEEWVKTSGVAAEGGDFDATKPGAGREADRLMEEKGIKKSTPGAPVEPSASAAQPSETKEKVSKLEKLKDKLHIGHKDK